MFTSNFNKQGNHAKAVSITQYTLPSFKGRVYKKLFPNESMIEEYNKTADSKKFTERYKKEILSKLNPMATFNELGRDSIILTRSQGGFDHKQLVVKWFKETLDIEVKELG